MEPVARSPARRLVLQATRPRRQSLLWMRAHAAAADAAQDGNPIVAEAAATTTEDDGRGYLRHPDLPGQQLLYGPRRAPAG